MRLISRAVAVLALAAAVAACGGDETETSSVRVDSLPDEIVTDFVTEETDSGRVRWKLSAPLAKRFNKQEVFKLDNPKIEFYDEHGFLQTTLTSLHGETSQATDMLAYGDVVVETIGGDVLETDSLRYISEEDKIVSDSFVKLTRGRDVMTGNGLECDHNLSSVVIKRNVKATIRDEEGKVDDQ